jgi:hypothetical protein
MKNAITALFVICFSLSVSACAGGGKCEKAIDKAMGFAKEMMSAMSGMAGGDAEKMKAEMEKQIEEGKKQALASCNEQLKADKAGTEKILDCVIAANKMEDLMQCEGAQNFIKPN